MTELETEMALNFKKGDIFQRNLGGLGGVGDLIFFIKGRLHVLFGTIRKKQ